jgi:hypothetical protein
MARERRRSGSAFSATVENELRCAIGELHAAVQSTNKQPVITHDELLNMFAPPEIVNILKQAPLVAQVSYYYSTNNFNITFKGNLPFTVNFQLAGDRKTLPLVPSIPDLQEGFETRIEEIEAWATVRTDISLDWSLVERLIKHLSKICTHPAQVRYIWPTLIGLMRSRGALASQVAELEDFKRPGTLPTISLELAEVCRQCSQIVATGLIMRDIADDKEPDYPVQLTLPDLNSRTRVSACAEIGAYHPYIG